MTIDRNDLITRLSESDISAIYRMLWELKSLLVVGMVTGSSVVRGAKITIHRSLSVRVTGCGMTTEPMNQAACMTR